MRVIANAHLRAAAVLGGLGILAACSENAVMPRAPQQALRPSLSLASIPTPAIEQLTVCKDGSSATFSITVNGVAGSDFTLQDGECVLADTRPAGQLSHTDVVTEQVPAGTVLDSIVDNGTHSFRQVLTGTSTITVKIGGDQGHVLVFYNRVLKQGSIGDFVWSDLNGNGIQDAGEPGIPGVSVTLGGAGSATTTTDANGAYLFTGLGAGDYTVTTTCPNGSTASPSGQGGDPAKDSNGSPASVNLPSYNSSDLTIDFGCVPAPTGSIGDFVWSDDNGDGIQDAGEPGLAGVTVTLGGAASATTTTDANGNYLFTGLAAGNYTVTVGTPSGFDPSPSFQGGDPNDDSNGSPASVNLPTSSSSDLSIDFGFVPQPQRTMGRMTGGGQALDINGVSVSRGLTLHCDIILSNNLEVNWGGNHGTNNFHITRPLTSATCILDPRYSQPPPVAPFNTFIGVADGTLNGVPGATARFIFIDAGEPGRDDMIQLRIWDANNNLVLDVPLAKITHGNLQAHYDQPHGSKP